MDDSQSSMTTTTGPDTDELDFLELIRVVIDYRLTILGVTLFSLLVAVIFAFATTPIYRAEILLAPADISGGSGGVSSILSRLGGFGGSAFSRLGQQDTVQQGIATLQSQRFTMDFIRENDLLPILFESQWDAELEQWDVSDPEEIPTYADGYYMFEGIREVEEDGAVVSLSIEWKDPSQAADWANATVKRINDQLRLRAIKEADQTITYLNKEIEKTRIVEIRQAIFSMIENQVNVRTVANTRDEYSFKIISPAIAPEKERYVWPNKSLIILVALVLGPGLGVFVSFFIFSIRRISSRLGDN